MKYLKESSPRQKRIEDFFSDIDAYMKKSNTLKNAGSRRVKARLRRKSRPGLPAVVTTNKTVARSSE